MDGLAYVFELVDPRGKLWNKFVSDTADPESTHNGFRRLIDDGHKLTGLVSIAEMRNGIVIKRVATSQRGGSPLSRVARKIVGGWHTSSAHLR